MAKAAYTDDDKVKVYVALAANEGMVKRTARETGIPESTVRRWKKEFAENPPAIEDIERAVGNFVEDADRVRGKALLLIEKRIDAGDAKVNELNNTVGILTDKIDRARGLTDHKVEHTHRLDASELRELMSGFVQDMKALSAAREAEIIDAEIVEPPKALPAPAE
jgi:transposase-like protein